MGNPKPPDPRGVPKQHGRAPKNPRTVKPAPRNRRKPPPPVRYDGHNPDHCCPMVAALVSVKQGKFRLARRYARMSVRLLAARWSPA